MIVTGIVVEYNPFHNGHIKHIKLAREKTQCDILVAVMSGNFVQRGEPAIFDKWSRTKAALEHEVDIIFELPFPYVNQNASVFAKAAVDILSLAKCDYIVFGSEVNDLDTLHEFANVSINVDHLKEKMSDGSSYPKAYSLLSREFYPNDILGIAYLKALKETNIKPVIIKRDNESDMLDKTLEIESATKTRSLIKTGIDVSHITPMLNYVDIKNAVYMEDFFPIIKTHLLTHSPDTLKLNALFAEGIENNLKKQASIFYNYTDFLDASISRRYTRARIQRTLTSMLTQLKQADLDNLPPINQLKVLGFNEVGQNYIRYLNKQKVSVVSKFNKLNKTMRDLELKAAATYITFLSPNFQKYLWDKEFQGPIIYKNNKFING
ncbi:MAG TPA: nucleotidyltransferase family protein [Erysipelotrichaceae bacterium]|nr:nucleotidyltransferase family protein [Erysipelotrichaceae bacterium]